MAKRAGGQGDVSGLRQEMVLDHQVQPSAPSPMVTNRGKGWDTGKRSVRREGRVGLAQLGHPEDRTQKAVDSPWSSRRNQYCGFLHFRTLCLASDCTVSVHTSTETFLTIQSWTLELQRGQASLTPLSQPPEPNVIPKDFPRGHQSEDTGNGKGEFIPSSEAGFSIRTD